MGKIDDRLVSIGQLKSLCHWSGKLRSVSRRSQTICFRAKGMGVHIGVEINGWELNED